MWYPQPVARDPNDPRNSSTHRERGAGVILRATWPEIAAVLDLSVHTAKKLGSGAERKFNPHDLSDLVRYVIERRARKTPRTR